MKSGFDKHFLLPTCFWIVATVIIFFGVLFSPVVYADSLGPNLSITATGSFEGTGPCHLGLNITPNTSATDPGFTVSATNPTCTGGSGTLGGTETISFTGLNGYLIDDISASVTCGELGGDTGSFTVGSLALNCPTETGVGATGTVSGESAFTPVSSLTVPFTLSATAVSSGSITFDSFSFNVSLVPPSVTPEPTSMTLLFAGLIGFATITRGRLLRS